MSLRASEWIAVAYFVYLAVAAGAVPLAAARRRRIVTAAVAVVTFALGLASFGSRPSASVLRDWASLAYLLLGYWVPALLVTHTNLAFERALLRMDHRWLGAEGPVAFTGRAPRALVEALELSYLCCYPLVPAGFACLYAAGLREESDRFWTAVLAAVFGCYGVLPWLSTRPPRAIEAAPASRPGLVRRLNLRVLGRASIQLNTFPSGHAAAAFATALAVGARLPIAGVALGAVALGIAIGSVVGRYHYAADAFGGVALALVGFVVSRFV